jgi:hypothetical protein
VSSYKIGDVIRPTYCAPHEHDCFTGKIIAVEGDSGYLVEWSDREPGAHTKGFIDDNFVPATEA